MTSGDCLYFEDVVTLGKRSKKGKHSAWERRNLEKGDGNWDGKNDGIAAKFVIAKTNPSL